MIRLALCLLLGGCATNVEVLPTFDQKTESIGCCLIAAQIPPSTSLTAQVTKSPDWKLKLSAKWRF
jgi:hypothetical protein